MDWHRFACVLTTSLVLLLSPASQGQTWNWTEQTIDPQPAKFPSIAADQDGNLHLLYSSDADGFKYAFRPTGDSRWFAMPLEGGNGYTQITIDSSGNPHACLAVNSASMIKYGYFKNSKWTFQQIAPGTGPVWFSCSVAISPDGTPHVTWYQERGADMVLYGHYKYAVLKDGVWMVRTIDMCSLTGKWEDMLVDKNGIVHISSDCFVNGELHYAVQDGTDWHVSIVDSRRLDVSANRDSIQESLGMGNSLLLDDRGMAHFSYMTDTALKYAEQTPNGFRTQTVDSIKPWGSWVGYRTSLVLDKKGFPHIAYEDSGTLKHAFWDGTRWNIQVLARNGPEPYRFSSMAIDNNGLIYVVYRDPDDGSLKVKIGKFAEKAGPEKTIQTATVEVDRATKPMSKPN